MGQIAASLFLGLSLVVSSECLASVRQLTFPPPTSSDLYPQFSPAGDKVAFVRQDPSWRTVFVVDVASGVADTLEMGLPSTWDPEDGMAWSPDGSQFVFNNDSGSALWIADAPSPHTQPRRHLVTVVAAYSPYCGGGGGGLWAIDDRGTLYEDRGAVGEWEIAGHVAGKPVHMTDALLITMANGDVWGPTNFCSGGPPPYTFTLRSNVFAAAGVTGVEGSAPRPAVGHLERARPNPFNPSTSMPYTLASAGRVTARVYDAAGRLVRTLEDGHRAAGEHVATWDGRDDAGRAAASGTYFARVTFPNGTTAERKMTILK